MNTRALAVKVLPPTVKRRMLHHRRQALDALIAYRIRSGRLGPLPSFLILGYGKCGTTELYDRLVEHPQIASSLTKEVNYFSHQYGRGLPWYRAHFTTARGQGVGGPLVSGEASPGYVCNPHAPGRIAEVVPEAKLIVLVRNPVDRAYSQYHHQRRLGFEPLPTFEAAIAAEPDRVRGEAERMEHDPSYHGFNKFMYSYLGHGIYADHLPRWLEAFPPDQLLVLQSEGFYRNTSATLRQVTSFVGLSDWTPRESTGHKAFRYPKMNPVTRAQLEEFFAPHNERLFDLLGVNYGWNN